MMKFPVKENAGKIGQPLFHQAIANHLGEKRPEVRVGPGFGIDVSLVDLPHELVMALTSDPLSLIPTLGLEASAWLSVHLMANDMATTGLAPMYGQFVLNLPASLTEADFNVYWGYIDQFCKEIGVAITGGHTGFDTLQHSTIAGGGTLITIAGRDQVLTSASARVGDVLLMTKHCALSSAAILALSFPKHVENKVGKELFMEACDSFYQTSSLQDALVAVSAQQSKGGISAMHDVTEGGVIGAVYELATASGLGVRIDADQLPVQPVQQQICALFELDYRRCIGAGSMLICCKESEVKAIEAALALKEIPCASIGVLTEASEGKLMKTGDQYVEIQYRQEDPYWAAFHHAIKKGRT